MKISAKGRYALEIMSDIAINSNGKYVSLREVAVRQNISPKYSEQIASTLSKRGMLISSRGPMGGYTLTREPAAYTVLEILEAVDDISMAEVIASPGNECCQASEFWAYIDKAVSRFLRKCTLDDVVTMKFKDNILNIN